MATQWGQWDPTSPFYNLNSRYGAEKDFRTTPAIKKYYDPNNPGAVFEAFLGGRGYGGFDARSQFANSLYNRAQRGYSAAVRNNPALDFERYLNRQLGGGKIESLFRSLSPTQRGENPSLYAPRVRMVRRG